MWKYVLSLVLAFIISTRGPIKIHHVHRRDKDKPSDWLEFSPPGFWLVVSNFLLWTGCVLAVWPCVCTMCLFAVFGCFAVAVLILLGFPTPYFSKACKRDFLCIFSCAFESVRCVWTLCLVAHHSVCCAVTVLAARLCFLFVSHCWLFWIFSLG